jgi:uncharacterized lipoprotein YddW (UPF0748 family)
MRLASRKGGQTKQDTTELPEVQSWETNTVIHSPIYITRFTANSSVPYQEMANHIKKRRSAKENNVSKSIKHYSYELRLRLRLW